MHTLDMLILSNFLKYKQKYPSMSLFFNSTVVDLQCVNFRCTAKWYIMEYPWHHILKYYIMTKGRLRIAEYLVWGLIFGKLLKPIWHLSNKLKSAEFWEKEMATHSSILAWRIPGTEEPGGLLSMGSHRVGHDWNDLAAAAAAPEF